MFGLFVSIGLMEEWAIWRDRQEYRMSGGG
jgi:hypothetical protein